jgi:hypothetical protein
MFCHFVKGFLGRNPKNYLAFFNIPASLSLAEFIARVKGNPFLFLAFRSIVVLSKPGSGDG